MNGGIQGVLKYRTPTSITTMFPIGGWMIKMGYYYCSKLGSVIIHPQFEGGCIARITFQMRPFPKDGEGLLIDSIHHDGEWSGLPQIEDARSC